MAVKHRPVRHPIVTTICETGGVDRTERGSQRSRWCESVTVSTGMARVAVSYRDAMAGLSPDERKTLEQVIAGRVGKRSDAKELVQAYLDAMHRNA
jgi:hypothetical protein